MKLTKRAKKARRDALKKIKNNIEALYGDPELQDNLRVVREDFHIYPGFYERYEDEYKKVRSIQNLTKLLKQEWIDQNFKDEKVTEIISTHHLRYNISCELDALNDEIKTAEVRKNLPNITALSQDYLRQMVDKYVNGINPIYWRKKINQDVWKSIMGAMLFNIPEKRAIALRESILIDYMPTINEHLQIYINELTTMGDLYYIEPKIKSMQKKYRKKHKNLNIRRKND